MKRLNFCVVFCLILALAFSDQAETKYSETVQRAMKSVVRVETPSINKKCYQGSGVILNKKGLIRTAWHVVKGLKKEESLKIILHNNNEYPAVVVRATMENDYALVQIIRPPEGLKPAPIADEISSLKIFAVGYPKSKREVLFGKMTSIGECVGIDIFPEDFCVPVIEIDTPIEKGYSGAPLFNEEGEILGIAVGTTKTSGFFVYTRRLKKKYNLR